MATPNTAAQPGTYRAADSPLIAGFAMTLTGTTWAEATAGGRYFLNCSSNDGAAVTQILEGKGTMRMGLGTFAKTINGTIQGGQNNNPGNSPAIKWLFSQSRSTFYKVLNVINNNKIEVEAVTGLSPGELTACGTYGYGVKSVTLSGNGGAVSAAGYQYNSAGVVPMEIADGDSVVLPVNLTVNGPLYVTGTGAVTVNA